MHAKAKNTWNVFPLSRNKQNQFEVLLVILVKMADIEERTAWYRRKPMLLFFLIFTVVLFLIALISNFIPQVSYDSNVDKDGVSNSATIIDKYAYRAHSC
jgi:hypothetical protein